MLGIFIIVFGIIIIDANHYDKKNKKSIGITDSGVNKIMTKIFNNHSDNKNNHLDGKKGKNIFKINYEYDKYNDDNDIDAEKPTL